MKDEKAPGKDGVASEVWKYEGEEMEESGYVSSAIRYGGERDGWKVGKRGG